jgi:alginate O-acetyltransferase complex protein AlgI
MVFTSHVFVFYFLPLCLLIYYLLPHRWRNLFLTLASYLFYGWWKPWFVSLMMISTAVDYAAGCAISWKGASQRQRKAALLVSVCTNLGLLGVFKYLMFLQANIDAVLEAAGTGGFDIFEITLPIGISFYTFQSMSYTIDVYRGVAAPVRRLSDFSQSWDFAVELTWAKAVTVLGLFLLSCMAMSTQAFNPFLYFQF